MCPSNVKSTTTTTTKQTTTLINIIHTHTYLYTHASSCTRIDQ